MVWVGIFLMGGRIIHSSLPWMIHWEIRQYGRGLGSRESQVVMGTLIISPVVQCKCTVIVVLLRLVGSRVVCGLSGITPLHLSRNDLIQSSSQCLVRSVSVLSIPLSFQLSSLKPVLTKSNRCFRFVACASCLLISRLHSNRSVYISTSWRGTLHPARLCWWVVLTFPFANLMLPSRRREINNHSKSVSLLFS